MITDLETKALNGFACYASKVAFHMMETNHNRHASYVKYCQSSHAKRHTNDEVAYKGLH